MPAAPEGDILAAVGPNMPSHRLRDQGNPPGRSRDRASQNVSYSAANRAVCRAIEDAGQLQDSRTQYYADPKTVSEGITTGDAG